MFSKEKRKMRNACRTLFIIVAFATVDVNWSKYDLFESIMDDESTIRANEKAIIVHVDVGFVVLTLIAQANKLIDVFFRVDKKDFPGKLT